MSVFDWLLFLAFAALAVGGAIGVRHQWQGESGIWKHLPAWWPWGEPAFKGWRRIAPLGLATIAVSDVIFLLGELGIYNSDGPGFWAAALLILLLFILFLLATTVAFYNRPHWVVAPHLRHEPGIVDAYKQRRRTRMRADSPR
jgi:hypothetical protein